MAGILGSIEQKERWEDEHGKNMDARKNLEAYLRAYFTGGVESLPPLAITRRETDGTGGKRLTTAFASHLEIASALAELHRISWLGAVAVQLRLAEPQGGQDLSWREIGRRVNQPYTAMVEEYDRAIDWLVEHIYDWTPGGKALAASAQLERDKAARIRGDN